MGSKGSRLSAQAPQKFSFWTFCTANGEHYAYPNSNIIPLGEAVGQVSQTTFFTPPQLSGAVERQAVAAALQTKSGADLLLNYVSEAKLTTVGFIFIFDYTVHGTAAQMEVGGKPLR